MKTLSVTTIQSLSRNALGWFKWRKQSVGLCACLLFCLYSEKPFWPLIRDIGISVCDHMFDPWWVMCVGEKGSDAVRVPPASYRLRWEQPGGARQCLRATVTGCDGWPLGISALEVLNEGSRAITPFLCMYARVSVRLCVSHIHTPLYKRVSLFPVGTGSV